MKTLMESEIFSEPQMLKRTIKRNEKTVKAIAKAFKEKNINNIVTMARGTSDNAATCFSFVCQLYAGIRVGKFHPSISTVYNANVNMDNTCMVVISQSGMSNDTIDVMRKNKKNGAMIVGITNNMDSPLAKESDFLLYMDVEEEKSVAATKTYVAELLTLFMLVDALAHGKINDSIHAIPDLISDALKKNDKLAEVAKHIKDWNNYLILSRGTMQGTCDEIGLKLTECCYLYTKAFSSANFMHGPLSLITKDVTVILLAPNNEFHDEFVEMAKRVKESEGKLISFSDIEEINKIADYAIEMPKLNNVTAPVYYGTVISLLALNIGLAKGINVDEPRNLKKVTITI